MFLDIKGINVKWLHAGNKYLLFFWFLGFLFISKIKLLFKIQEFMAILSSVISNFEWDGDEIQNEDCYMTHLSCMKEY